MFFFMKSGGQGARGLFVSPIMILSPRYLVVGEMRNKVARNGVKKKNDSLNLL